MEVTAAGFRLPNQIKPIKKSAWRTLPSRNNLFFCADSREIDGLYAQRNKEPRALWPRCRATLAPPASGTSRLALEEHPGAMTALGAMRALRKHGFTIPEAFGLVCFDDVEHLAILALFMTVVDQPAEGVRGNGHPDAA
jgi:hypothetical protein